MSSTNTATTQGDATETETVTEKTCTTDTEVTQTITGSYDLPIVNTRVEGQSQGTPLQPPSSPTDSASLVVSGAVSLNTIQTPPSTPTSTSHLSDELWAQVEDLSGLVDAIDLAFGLWVSSQHHLYITEILLPDAIYILYPATNALPMPSIYYRNPATNVLPMPSIYYGNPATNALPTLSIYYGNPATNALPIPSIYYGNPAAKYQYLTYIAYKKLLTSLQHLTLCAPNTKLQRSVEKHNLNQRKRAMHVTDFKNRGAELDTQDLFQRLDSLWLNLGYCAGTTQYEWLESNGMLIVTAVDQEGWDSVKPGCDAGLAEAKELLQQAYTLCTDACAVEGPLTDQLRDGIASALDAVKLHVHAWEELLVLMDLGVEMYFDALHYDSLVWQSPK
ncbi:uncharacterized protein EDB91DRAFT_1088832 [Suillus paluster]|uniref:uncharacterized protein n=1 Tax=Suillus paluster TaxID=48578 RepID=UPI001B872D57|nr:uncharacterized protein EDB91DRAFT_1088832 [Suillus paluster]KAG1720455.1 hypothetical protein EDB91DRAFT_1088832 [Suillus paluster]